MDRSYEVYCLSDPTFYDSPVRSRGDDVDFDLLRQQAPEGWARSEMDDWLVYRPDASLLPTQGWKIHASACLDDAEQVLQTVWDYCIPRGIAFKAIRSPQLLFVRSSKYADRGASGKFITIYPTDEAQLETILNELGDHLSGRQGPYILSDLRWGDGPLFVRYGGFAERYCVGPSGEMEAAILDGDGNLVPDRREAVFSVPDWVELPSCLVPHLAARSSATVTDLPYTIDRALHFSNGGGVYVGTHRASGDTVLIKEARPYAGLSVDRADAVARLRHEQAVLERLAGLDSVPRLRDMFELGGHHFLVRDYVEATALSALIAERYPLVGQEGDRAALADYAAWALAIHDRVVSAVAAMHDRGVCAGDLHPSNILVRDDGSIAVIDFEVASWIEEGRRPTLADPAFAPPRGCTGPDVDRYALACLRFFLFLPLTALFALDPAKPRGLAREIAPHFGLPADVLDDATRTVEAARPPAAQPDLPPFDPSAWPALRDAMVRAILAAATPHRDDRLFPGDIEQFETGGLNLAYGAAGVLYAVAAAGGGRYEDYEAWVVQRALHPRPGTRLGFWDGLHGVAYALEELGRRDDALAVLGLCTHELAGKWEHLGLDLFGGLAGIGLNLLHFADRTGHAALREEAERVAAVVADRLGGVEDVPELSGGEHPYGGLLRGASGPALLFLRLFEHTGDPVLLDLAETAVRQDLRRCVTHEDGTFEMNEGWRTMPYIGEGSVGVGLVLTDLLRHRPQDDLVEAADAIRRTAEGGFFIEPGLFWGRAGMLLHLSRLAGTDTAIARGVRRLAWHAIPHAGGVAFPGEQLLRLSMDLATGTAGVLLGVAAALHDEPVHLPFLERSGVGEARREPTIAGRR